MRQQGWVPMEINSDATTPRIRPHPSRDGVQIVDPIQDAQFTLLTPDPVDTSGCSTDRFYFPVDSAVAVETDSIETPYFVSAWLRDEFGNLVKNIEEGSATTVPPDRYNIELSTTQVKLYLIVEGGVTVESRDNCIRFSLRETDRMYIGARSLHQQPAATVETTDKPEDIMAALSTFGSALKTTTCERSFPTLRGHPPLLQRGDELSIPDNIQTPETGLTVEVPRSLEYLYPIAPLAYYLGAAVKPGSVPRLVAQNWEYPLGGDKEFESTVANVLKRVFLLDCVTRTEGYYDVDLHERNIIEEQVDLDFKSLYDRPIADQVRTYLDISHTVLSDAMPRWKLTADVKPNPEFISTLPFLANELAVIQSPPSLEKKDQNVDNVVEQVESIFRGNPSTLFRGTQIRTTQASSSSTIDEKVFRPTETDSIEHVYVGEGIPFGASKMTVDSYYRRLEYEPSDQPRIRVIVVCNDERMADENIVSEIYGTRDWIQFDITFKEELSTKEMRTLLQTDADFLHYIGHVDENGIRCPDGHLDTNELREVNISAFLLNACDSYDQGYGLVEHGAMAGIATVTDVVNEAATSVGRTVAKLLNQGFSLASTMSIIEEHEQIGHHYIVIGDGNASIVDNQSGTPHRVSIEKINNKTYDCTIFGYPNLSVPMGSMFTPQIDNVTKFYINSGEMYSDTVSKEALNGFLSKQEVPIEIGDSLCWSTEMGLDDPTDRQ